MCYFINKYCISLNNYGIYFIWGIGGISRIYYFTMADLYSVSFTMGLTCGIFTSLQCVFPVGTFESIIWLVWYCVEAIVYYYLILQKANP